MRIPAWIGLATIAGLMLTGCESKQLPDPNDPISGEQIKPRALQSDLLGITNLLSIRRQKREIREPELRERIVTAAKELVKKARITSTSDEDAWRYAEVLRAAEQWPEVIPFLQQAVKYAKATNNVDRWVNDSLRLAQAQAHVGQVSEAIAIARTVFGVGPKDSIPILFGVALEIEPAAEGKGHDIELAKLLEDAIETAWKTQVDVKTAEGSAYMVARRYHINRATLKLMQLYERAGKPEEAQAALKRLDRYFQRT